MKKPDWTEIAPENAILREPALDENLLILWVPGTLEAGFKNWERIASVPRTAIKEAMGLCSIAATSMQAQQEVRGLLGRIRQRFQKNTGDRNWLLPNGTVAEQVGERQPGRLLVWASNPADPIDETLIREKCGAVGPIWQLGKNLYLVVSRDSETAADPEVAHLAESDDLVGVTKPCAKAREQANRLLSAARNAKDRAREAAALTDLGVVHLREGKFQQALDDFDEALVLARQLKDRSLESDVLTNQALALLGSGQLQRAGAILAQEIVHAQENRDLYHEKTALDHSAKVHVALGKNGQALALYQRALAIAKKACDRQHQADILWLIAIQHAQLGQRDQATTIGRMAIDIYADMGNPNTAEFAENLRQYSQGTSSIQLAWNKETGTRPGGHYSGQQQRNGDSIAATQPRGTRLLWNVFLGAKSLAKFFGSGMKRVPQNLYRERLSTCTACPHHTGVRCKVCGCFTSLKAWLPHEQCPIGKWSQSSAEGKSQEPVPTLFA
jgi:tetratricopeptide (TPR) repeat protein